MCNHYPIMLECSVLLQTFHSLSPLFHVEIVDIFPIENGCIIVMSCYVWYELKILIPGVNTACKKMLLIYDISEFFCL